MAGPDRHAVSDVLAHASAALTAGFGAEGTTDRPGEPSGARRREVVALLFRLVFLIEARQAGRPGAPDLPSTWPATVDLFRELRGDVARPSGLPLLPWSSGLWAADRSAGLESADLADEVLASVNADLAELVNEVDGLAITGAYDSLLSPAGSGGRSTRKRQGSWYTPPHVVEQLLRAALDPVLDQAAAGPDPTAALLGLRIADPACGTGNFLVMARRRLAQRLDDVGAGRPAAKMAAAITQCLAGVDTDPLAVDICRTRLWLEGGDAQLPLTAVDRRVVVEDSLLGRAPRAPEGGRGGPPAPSRDIACGWGHWFPDVFPPTGAADATAQRRGGFDVVVGNPPFLNQLRRDTAVGRKRAAALRSRWGDLAAGYGGPAPLFLALGVDLARPDGGRVALVMPHSFLSSRDAERARAYIGERAVIADLWVTDQRLFDAAVQVCAPTLVRRPGGPAAPPGPDRATWVPLVAERLGVPAIELGQRHPGQPATGSTLAGLAAATADFRDQYYGILPFVTDGDAGGPAPEPHGDLSQVGIDQHRAPVVTVGLIDPARCLWGRRAARLGGRRWAAPMVDLRRLRAASELGPWADGRRVPKLLVATQTKVVEVAVDESGRLLPSVPVITVVPEPDRLWHVAAVLLSPAVTAWAAGRFLGAGLSSQALKLSASQVLTVPVPDPGGAWDDAAASVRAATTAGAAGDEQAWRRALDDAGRRMADAYGLDRRDADRARGWWLDRLPPFR